MLKNKKILIVLGTRPEAIKLAPLIHCLKGSNSYDVSVCSTGQHVSMVKDALAIFDLGLDYSFESMNSNKNLSELLGAIIKNVNQVIEDITPTMVIVHGDTATTLGASLASYFNKIPVGHVEAGLRTNNVYSPWPEEGNRQVVSKLATINFAPTLEAANNLKLENIDNNKIVITGNTVIDSLFFVRDYLNSSPVEVNKIIQSLPDIDFQLPYVLITTHRRENFGKGLNSILDSILELSLQYPDVQFVLPIHLNPNVKIPIETRLSGLNNVFLIPPQSYQTFVYLMMNSHFILTDSGGIQEEAPSLGIQVLLMRDTTERPEVLNDSSVILVGTDKDSIIKNSSLILAKNKVKKGDYNSPYGTGDASIKIKKWIDNNV